MLKKLNEQFELEEREVQNEIQNHIKNKQSFIFNAGAGAGKTYSLIKSLQYVINCHEEELRSSCQKIMCITYTNVATEKIKEHLGNSILVEVSTIHERIWNIIGPYQEVLVQIHLENVIEKCAELEKEIEENSKYGVYNSLSHDEKLRFEKALNDSKEQYYKYYGLAAKEYREYFKTIDGITEELLKNKANFQKIVNTIYKIQNYKMCIEGINASKDQYKAVTYDALYNDDQLHRMRISHDTLLDYGYKMVTKYDLLKKLLIDQFPYIFIDEYQDTNQKVIEIMKMLFEYVKESHHKVLIGLFGDTVQNIYEDGVGENVHTICSEFKSVNKIFNRRSAYEIIEVSNRVRADAIEQKSIYEDCRGGSVAFYSGKGEDANRFIEKEIIKREANMANPLHCFVLTNKTVAQYSGFEKIYDTIKATNYYKQHYNQLNSELLSGEIEKMGVIPKWLFTIIGFLKQLESDMSEISGLLEKSEYSDITLEALKEVIALLKQIKGTTLKENLVAMCKLYDSIISRRVKNILERILDIDIISFEQIEAYLLRTLFPELLDNEEERAKELINDLLEINLTEYKRWLDYLNNVHQGTVVYHTYHGTKGLQFDNVVIIMGNQFGKEKNYFNYYYKNFGIDDSQIDKEKMDQIRNLLYVSLTRAIKNVSILYIDDITEFNDTLELIYGKVISFEEEHSVNEEELNKI